MSDREQVEGEIQHLLATETQAMPLSNKLFSPDGLFARLADTEDQRRAVAQSPLFKQAQGRLMELQRHEAAAFARAVEQLQAGSQDAGYFVKLERTQT